MILTKTKNSKKIEDRNAKITTMWNGYYVAGETQITPLAESIAKTLKCSLSTVKRIVKPLIKKK